MARRKRRGKYQKINHQVWISILGIFCGVLGLLLIASFIRQGNLLIWLNNLIVLNFGSGALVIPFIFLQLTLICFQSPWIWSRPPMLLGGLLFFAGLSGLTKGGSIGGASFSLLSSLITTPGAWLFFFAVIVAGLLILWQVSFHDLLNWWKKFSTEKKLRQHMSQFAAENDEVAYVGQDNDPDNLSDSPADEEISQIHLLKNKASSQDSPAANNDDETNDLALTNLSQFNKIELLGDVTPTTTAAAPKNSDDQFAPHPAWQYPSLSLLNDTTGGQADRGDISANAQIIENTLDSFGIRARVVETNRGPSVTQYALEIAMGTKLSKITALATDLALALAAPTGQIRIEAPIAGKSLVGVEVPNRRAAYVTLKKMLGSNSLKEHPSKLAVAMGIDVNGKQIVGDIAKMPHVLIAGATGSGKSVGINSFLCSLLFRCSPEELRLILVDPKRVELTMYQDIPHLLTPVIVDASKVVSALKWACDEMDQRYHLLAENQVRNIDSYNAKPGIERIPNIIIVIDEFADVMMYSPNEVEEAVTRLAQMARAVGIHLVLSTQRPSVNVITGLIKANIPTRIAFNVASAMDSRVVLDTIGAEKLLGNGDMLYIPPDQAKPIRIQGTFVDDVDARKLTDFLKSQGWQPEYLDDVTSKFRTNASSRKGATAATTESDLSDKDDLFTEAVRMFAQYDHASSSMIQRRLSVGYARAARILDQLYAVGIVGPAKGSKPRDVNRDAINAYLSDPNNLAP
jgi:S-DNA-T family DNA segregation ATPase FtsK/SpoIIIE